MRRSLFASTLFAVALSVVALSTIGLGSAHAEMQARPVEWKVGKDTFSGYLVYDDTNAIKRPGVVMVPDWKGVTDAAIDKAKHIAGDDYVVLLADVYGKDVRPKNDDEAQAQVKKLYATATCCARARTRRSRC
jgi:dienelactone hydrolase